MTGSDEPEETSRDDPPLIHAGNGTQQAELTLPRPTAQPFEEEGGAFC